jgi:EAL domain-containing protein (putative c-di-GMP-specific phosphodiesterase class I)
MADQVAREALERALDEKDLLLVYQPIFDTTTRQIYSAEALVRQRRQSGEIREASAITEAAEEGPELFAFDSWSMRQAYEDAVKWHQRAPHVRLNVNLSAREFQEGNPIPRLTKLVTGCGIDTGRINLEITETTYIDQPEETMDVLAAMKKLGISLWLDDFGTGHSSMEHLQHFPVDGLKIPGTFVAHMVDDSRCRAITRALVNLAHDLGLKVVAEGVEHRAQLDLLEEWHCDYIQGFLLGKPMQLDDFERLIG